MNEPINLVIISFGITLNEKGVKAKTLGPHHAFTNVMTLSRMNACLMNHDFFRSMIIGNLYFIHMIKFLI